MDSNFEREPLGNPFGFKGSFMTNVWQTMESYHPCTEASWRQAHDGVFEVGDDFYERSGCIFQLSDHYEEMFAFS